MRARSIASTTNCWRSSIGARNGRARSARSERRPVYGEREAAILRAWQEPIHHGSGVGAIFREVISACRGLEQTSRVAYLGPQGTFSEMAVLRQFGHAVEAIPCASIDEVFRAAEAGECQFAVVPVENSTDGAVARSLDLLLATPQKICAEIVLRVHQNAMWMTPVGRGCLTRTVARAVQRLARPEPAAPSASRLLKRRGAAGGGAAHRNEIAAQRTA